MDAFERDMTRARALWRNRNRGWKSLWGFENWATDQKEAHHIARERYGDQLIDIPTSMHWELTRRQLEEHPSEGPDPDNPFEREGRLYLGLADIYECKADFCRERGEALIRKAKAEGKAKRK